MKETSPELSSLSARIFNGYEPSRSEILSMAGSLLSQDETRGQNFNGGSPMPDPINFSVGLTVRTKDGVAKDAKIYFPDGSVSTLPFENGGEEMFLPIGLGNYPLEASVSWP